jgi:hypothetical protein
MTGPARAMSVFEHYVALCSMAHMEAIRAAREGKTVDASAVNVKLFHRMHRLEALAAEMGAEALFVKPKMQISPDELRRMFPDTA